MKTVFILFLSCLCLRSFSQNVGIGTTAPHSNALLHVDLEASTTKGLLVTGAFNETSTVPNLGHGSRLMFYPGKAAFRAGYAHNDQWDNINVGIYSAAMGYATIANGSYSTALGRQTRASGEHALAMGYSASASGSGAVAIGNTTNASGMSSVAIGDFAGASGFASVSIGNATVASGNSSTAMGYFTNAKGSYSTASGFSTVAGGSYSFAAGYETIAKGSASTVVGMYNDTILPADEVFSFGPTPMFIVGNGSNTARSNAFVVRKDGKVGVGNIVPEYTLDVENRMRLRGGGNTDNTAGIWYNNINNTGLAGFIGVLDNSHMGFYGTGGANWGMVMNTVNGNVGIGGIYPAEKLHVAGNICATGTIASCSDIRYKTNILPVANALSAVLSINPIYYYWKKDFKDKGFTDERQIGFSAQEIEKLYPEMVQTNSEGYKAVDYSRLTPVLVQAVKEQQKQIDEKQQQIDELKIRLEKLEKLLVKQ